VFGIEPAAVTSLTYHSCRVGFWAVIAYRFAEGELEVMGGGSWEEGNMVGNTGLTALQASTHASRRIRLDVVYDPGGGSN
jgi:hypothetical protein